jgi:hypothetical protein
MEKIIEITMKGGRKRVVVADFWGNTEDFELDCYWSTGTKIPRSIYDYKKAVDDCLST